MTEKPRPTDPPADEPAVDEPEAADPRAGWSKRDLERAADREADRAEDAFWGHGL